MSASYCTECGYLTQDIVPPGDNRVRQVCENCGHIRYENPKNVVGCLLEWEGQVLLCKRAIEPRYGCWTLPAGFMENNESTMQGAAREAYEEATATGVNLRLFAIYSLPSISQVFFMFHGQLRDGFAQANEETLEVGLFREADIPWDELSFPVMTEALTRYFEGRDQPSNGVYCADFIRHPDASLEIVRHQ